MSRYSRSASFVITLFGIITNSALAIQVLAASRSIKWEPEFEWETSNDTWRVDGVKVVWGLLLSYFVSAATVCAIGFVGVVKVRCHRSPKFDAESLIVAPARHYRASLPLSGSIAITLSPIFPSARSLQFSAPMGLFVAPPVRVCVRSCLASPS